MPTGLVFLLLMGAGLGPPSFMLQMKDMQNCVMNAKFFMARMANDKTVAACFDMGSQSVALIQLPKPEGEKVD